MALEEKEVTEIGKDILKSDANPTFLLSTLKNLKAGVKPTEDFLRTTKIGVAVAKLKQCKDTEVQKEAASLVASWRAEIKKQKEKAALANGAGKTPSRSSTPSVATPGAAKSPAQAQSKAVKAKVPPEKRSADSDGVNVNKTGDKTRDGSLKLMYNGLAFMSEEPSDHILATAINIEAAAWKSMPPTDGDASSAYRAKMRSLFQNLKQKSNAGLRLQLLSGAIKPEKFVKMSDEELQSSELQQEIATLEKENLHEAMVPQEEKSITRAFTCGKCKNNKVSYSQAQTRSADEPMTTFCKCEICGNRWKFS